MVATLTAGPRVGTLLAQARKDAGYSQKEFGALLDVNAATISSWENGKSYPSIITWMRVIEVTGADWLGDLDKLPSCWSVETAACAA